jgi:hypothetical protein
VVIRPPRIHPKGEKEQGSKSTKNELLEVETYDGKVFVEWDHQASVTPLAQLPFFIEFLKLGCRFEPWVEGCPLEYTSNNAPTKTDVLGSIFLAVLSGHKRFAHITCLKNDGVSTKLLNMNKMVSDDSARRALKKIDEFLGIAWLQEHLKRSYEPLLTTSWILDCDVTVKPLFGHQEGAVIGYNPHKPGRPAHTYHSYIFANLRLVLDVEVQAGNQHHCTHSMPGLIGLLSRIDKKCWPAFIRGDCDWGTDIVMKELESLGMNYLFKLKKHPGVKALIFKQHSEGKWQSFKGNWEAANAEIQLSNWDKKRRVVLVRRRIKKDNALVAEVPNIPKQLSIAMLDDPEDLKLYEYSVLITSMECDLISIVQHYRDRADCENVFDEIKNQWGWGGFTTQDIKTSQFMSRITALIYNWWNLFVRLANPDGYQEAISSRPLLLTSIGRLTESGRQKKMTIASQHGWADKARQMLTNLNQFLSAFKSNAPQLNPSDCWKRITDAVVARFALQRGVGPPALAGA